MASYAVEDVLDIDCATLQAATPSPSHPWPCYPLPPLSLKGERQIMSLRTVALENPYVRAVFALDLGGRLLYLHDRRTGLDVLPRGATLDPIAGGPRGAWLGAGVQLIAEERRRRCAMATVDHLIQDGDDDAPAQLLMHEIVPGTGLSWHASWSLASDAAELELSVRVLNRTLAPTPYVGGLLLPLTGAAYRGAYGLAIYDEARDAGLVVSGEPWPFELADALDGELALQRLPEGARLAPRQTDSWMVRLAPISDLGRLSAFSPDASIGAQDDEVRVQVARPFVGAKVVLQTEQGALEAPVPGTPENLTRLSLTGAPAPQRIALVGCGPDLVTGALSAIHGRHVWVDAPPPKGDTPRSALMAASLRSGDAAGLWACVNEPALRASALVALAGLAFGRKEYGAADALLEEALTVNGEDALAWWLRAVGRRLREGPQDERPEILNAHFLAPLEPALRAEAFLSQTEPHGKDPSPLVAPLAGDPEALIEVACLLLDAGLPDQATRWIDEALRHGEQPILRYLLAAALLADTRMAVEAADHVRRAAGVPRPPFPWRPAELWAIAKLAERFPEDASLRSWLEIARARQESQVPTVNPL